MRHKLTSTPNHALTSNYRFGVWARLYNFRGLIVLIAVHAAASFVFGNIELKNTGPFSFYKPPQIAMMLPFLAGFIVCAALQLESNGFLPDPWRFKLARAGVLVFATIMFISLGLTYLFHSAFEGVVEVVRNTLFATGAYILMQRRFPTFYWAGPTTYLLLCAYLGSDPATREFYWWALPLWEGTSQPHLLAACSFWLAALITVLWAPLRTPNSKGN